jgi:hypothetical protein
MKDIQENTDRFTALSEYDIKDATTVRFDVGSSKISAADQEQLRQVAQTAQGLKGYIIEVLGYADSRGSAAINDKLSEDRAKAVIRYLVQQGNVPVRHIVAPGAMGEYGAKAPNETAAGRAENRRVEVKVLVNMHYRSLARIPFALASMFDGQRRFLVGLGCQAEEEMGLQNLWQKANGSRSNRRSTY